MRLPRPTYANVVSTVALVLALGGGTAYATGLVTTSQIANGAVTNPKLASGAVSMDKLGATAAADLGRPRAWALFQLTGSLGSEHYTMVGAHNIVGFQDFGSAVCVQLAPSIKASTATPIVSVQGYNAYDPIGHGGTGNSTGLPIYAYWTSDPNNLYHQFCSEPNIAPNDVTVLTGYLDYAATSGGSTNVAAEGNQESFTILIP